MSLNLSEYVDLRPFNTFGVSVIGRRLIEAQDEQQVRDALELARGSGWPVLVLGGGSNLLLTRDVDALILRMCTRGVRVLGDDGVQVVVEAEAGECWHPFVRQTLAMGLCGLENLSLIPGTVGAAPIQNIGAYGVEIKDVFAGLTAIDMRSGETRDFSPAECEFGYRESRFKREAGRWLILRVRFALSRTARLKLDYGPLRQRLQERGISAPGPQDVSRAVCAIRQEKLPDPKVLGNAGSFFKNPVVSAEAAERLRLEYPDLIGYPQADGRVKLAAGWLIEKAGWKGVREGDAGVHSLQALVLVNYGQASGEQLLQLARKIQADIQARFAVELEIEPVAL